MSQEDGYIANGEFTADHFNSLGLGLDLVFCYLNTGEVMECEANDCYYNPPDYFCGKNGKYYCQTCLLLKVVNTYVKQYKNWFRMHDTQGLKCDHCHGTRTLYFRELEGCRCQYCLEEWIFESPIKSARKR